MFALTLTGAAREWFEKLPAGQIKSWNDFIAKFSQHFSQQKKHTRDPSEILDVTRRNNESIEDFITRFTNESLNIGGSPRVEFQTPRPNRQAKGPIWSRLQPSAETPKPFDARSLIGNKGKRNFSARSTNSWTQLSKTPSEILTTENLTFRKPQPIPRKSFLDTKKHCSYHNDVGHNTNECVALRTEIEAAVKNGKLEHLVKGVRAGTGKPPAKDNQGPAKRQIKDLNIHMIQGGHSGKGKRRDYEDEEWKSEPVIFPRIKGGPCNKNPLIITVEFGHYRSQYVFFDTGSTSDIMYEQCFEQLDDEDKERLQPIHAPVYGFGGEIMHMRGVITFLVTLSDGVRSRTEEVEFLVLPATSKHDIILGREAIGDFNAHPSTEHGAVGVPTRTGVAIIHVNRHCFATESSRPSKVLRQAQRTEPEKWILNKKFPDQTVIIGPSISEIVRTFLKQLLIKNIDIFAWQPADMTGVPRSISEHKLKVNPLITPIV
ncbi:uncharacterized protein LOC143625956 [Bidens hawaiensis]|uniref:uncharacterized protein LOC143625956 n=1 Tax=Bidens hawaiensis TaxID=980011 RepID=UPI00404AE421